MRSLLLLAAGWRAAAAQVYFNEIHYTDTTVPRQIEIAGPAGTSLERPDQTPPPASPIPGAYHSAANPSRVAT